MVIVGSVSIANGRHWDIFIIIIQHGPYTWVKKLK